MQTHLTLHGNQCVFLISLPEKGLRVQAPASVCPMHTRTPGKPTGQLLSDFDGGGLQQRIFATALIKTSQYVLVQYTCVV